MTANLEPDQVADRWNEHVAAYEAVFEPFTLALSAPAFGNLGLAPGARVLDVAAGPGAAAMALATAGYKVTAIDGAEAMVSRISERAGVTNLAIETHVMDAGRLEFADGAFDAALSAFGVVLVPDAVGALAEMRRVVRPGGRIALVTWTEPQRYELAAALMTACDAVWPDRPRPALPAQLRYREHGAFAALFEAAGLPSPEIETSEAHLEAPSARWLAERLDFAPGMGAMLSSLGARKAAVIDSFVRGLEARFPRGSVRLAGSAFIGVSQVE